MKKFLIIVISLLLVAGIAVGVYMVFPKPQSALPQILPEGAIGYIHLTEIQKNLKQLIASPIYQSITGLNFDLLIEKNILQHAQKASLEMFKTQLESFANGQLFAKEIALVVYPADFRVEDLARTTPELASSMVILNALSNSFIVLRIDPKTQIAEFFSRMVGTAGNDILTEPIEYNNHTFYKIVFTKLGVKIVYLRVQDYFILAIDEENIKKEIDVVNKQASSLADDERFLQASGRFVKDASVLGYWNIEGSLTFLREQTEQVMGSLVGKPGENRQQIDAAQKSIDETFNKISGIKSMGLSAKFDVLTEMKFNYFFDRNQLSPSMAVTFACSNSENKTISFVPANVLGYSWSNCLHPGESWKQWKEQMAKIERAGPPLSGDPGSLSDVKLFGLDVENDIIPAFGEEMGGYLADLQSGAAGQTPLLKLAFFIKINDLSKAETVINKLAQQSGLSLQSEEYQSAKINYASVLPNIEPSYSIAGDYLILGVNRHVIKEAIDASADKDKSLSSDPHFKDMDFGLTESNRAVHFYRVDQMMEKLKSVLGWANSMSGAWAAGEEQKKEAFKAGSLKRLEESKMTEVNSQNEIDNLQKQIETLNAEITTLKSSGSDAAVPGARKTAVEQQIASAQWKLKDAQEQSKQLESIVTQYQEKPGMNATDRTIVLEGILFPVLDALASIESMASRTYLQDDSVESQTFLKMK